MSETRSNPASMAKVGNSGVWHREIQRIPSSKIPVKSRSMAANAKPVSERTSFTKMPTKIPRLLYRGEGKKGASPTVSTVTRTTGSRIPVKSRAIVTSANSVSGRRISSHEVVTKVPQLLHKSGEKGATRAAPTPATNAGSRIPVKSRGQLSQGSVEKKQSRIPRPQPVHKVKEAKSVTPVGQTTPSRIPLRSRDFSSKPKGEKKGQTVMTGNRMETNADRSSSLKTIKGSKIPVRNKQVSSKSGSGEKGHAFTAGSRKESYNTFSSPVKRIPGSKIPIKNRDSLAARITQIVRKIRSEMEAEQIRKLEITKNRRIKMLRRLFRM